MAFIGYSDSWGELLLRGLTKTTEAGGHPDRCHGTFRRTDNSVTALVPKLVAARPDAVFVRLRHPGGDAARPCGIAAMPV